MNYQHVMVLLDGSDLSESVLEHLDALASNCSITTVELVRAVPHLEIFHSPAVPIDDSEMEQLNQAALKEAEEYLQLVKQQLDPAKMTVTTTVLFGKVADILADYIESSGADLLVMATHGRSGLGRWYWGSTAEKLLRTTCIPIFLVRPPECRYKR